MARLPSGKFQSGLSEVPISPDRVSATSWSDLNEVWMVAPTSLDRILAVFGPSYDGVLTKSQQVPTKSRWGPSGVLVRF